MAADLPWDQPELPVIDRPDRFTRLDLAGPHSLVACGFDTQERAEAHIRYHDLAPTPPDGWTGQPIPVLMVEHRVGRGWCVCEYPRYQLSRDPVPF